MKRINVVFALLIVNTCFGQILFKNERLGFNIEQPENWLVAKNEEIVENIKKQIKLDTETINKLLEQNKGTIQVVTFYKYPIETTPGVIPTIKVNLRKNISKTFEDFRKVIEQSFSGIKKVFPDFKFLTDPVKTQISAIDCVKAVCAYTLKAKNGEEKVTITVYAVPIKNQFFQITFMDSEKEDNTKLYNELVKTIEIY
ncbi:MAG: hypothetical protein CFE24_12240 [Flavobacterium sp. BFFFF2]|nr:MAG: hypothetical protein CFE24_12240 [Flavobacterium sp. BFFFF2]